MKRLSLVFTAAILILFAGCGKINTNILEDDSLTESQIVAGLKQALEVGSENAGGRLAVLDGYFGNALIKIIMPEEAVKVENTLRSIGLGGQVDQAIEAMNRAAEDAATKAAPIFIDAITAMSVQDGLGILNGGNGAATTFLQQQTTAQLTSAFSPVISTSLEKVNATKFWNDIFTVYNALPTTVNKINPDLTAHVTEKALKGLFVVVEEEENKIREDPAARVTDLLKDVFGSLD